MSGLLLLPRVALRVPATLGVDWVAGNAYRVVRVLPAGHQDQHRRSGHHREQDDQASGLRPSGLGRSSDLGNQAPEGAIPFIHCCLPGQQRDAHPWFPLLFD